MKCTVITSSRSPGISGGLTYDAKDLQVQEGSHVVVPLRKEMVEGIVIDIQKEKSKEEFDLKNIEELIGERPLLNKPQIQTLRWMAEYYHCSLRQALRVWLPSKTWMKLGPQKVRGYKILNYHLPKSSYRLINARNQELHLMRQLVIEYVKSNEWVSRKNLKAQFEISDSQLRGLLKKGILCEEERIDTIECDLVSPEVTLPSLTPEQKKVFESIKKDDRPSLLFGVTSSGKTEIYAELIADVVRDGKQAILLVPEILLTEHCINRFQELLGEDHVVVVHSRLTPTQRAANWRRIHRGEISLVIGSRSALFTPLPNLGLVIMDEEHEWTYKNEQTPRYHARETAQALCRFSKAKFVMGTATPSLEAWSRAKSGTYNLTRLPNRYKDQPMPDVRIVDLATVKFGSLYPFSPPLLEAIDKRLKNGEQSVLFLNRRGIASSMMCLDCRRRMVSPESNLPFTLHRTLQGEAYLLDHTSGVRAEIPTECPGCGSTRLHALGAGTQRIEEILEKQFPNARLLRADSDTLTHPEQMRLLLKKMREGHADILLGTQSVVKGLDLPNVTLAAVLVADVGLSLPHFRAGERIYQLLTQLTGRSGRAKAGEVIIQTFRPDAPEVKLAANHNTEKFLDDELKLRLKGGYPPATKMIRLIIREEGAPFAKSLCENIKATAIKEKIELTANYAPMLFGGGKMWHVLIKGNKPEAILNKIDLKGVVVDVDPMECV
ncbi:MAG: primosomal protein N' [Kiritimatiellales bacterium]|nr:primosomal protein N' [Kiritimatiellales bacterium]